MVLIFQALEIFFGYLGIYSTKKRNIFIFFVISTIFSILSFYSVGKIAAILPVATTGIRYFIFIFKDNYKTKYPLYFCLLLHTVALIISTKTIVDIIPSLLVISGCLIYWYLDKTKLKGSLLILNVFWLAYYIYCGLYLTSINVVLQNIVLAISYYKIKEEEKKQLASVNKEEKLKKKKTKIS